MGNVVVVGAQWGDEGKGKIVDWLSERADVIARFQGGHNAGHTLVVGDTTYKLSLLPSGIVTGTLSLIGNAQVGWMYFFARRYDEGAAASLKVIEMDPNFFSARRYYGLILEQKGQYEQAVEQLEKAREQSGGSPVVIAALGHAYALAGKRHEAEKIIEELLDPSKPRKGSAYDVAVVYVGLGEKEKARLWYGRAIEWTDKHQPQNEDLKRVRAEAEELMKDEG